MFDTFIYYRHSCFCCYYYYYTNFCPTVITLEAAMVTGCRGCRQITLHIREISLRAYYLALILTDYSAQP